MKTINNVLIYFISGIISTLLLVFVWRGCDYQAEDSTPATVSVTKEDVQTLETKYRHEMEVLIGRNEQLTRELQTARSATEAVSKKTKLERSKLTRLIVSKPVATSNNTTPQNAYCDSVVLAAKQYVDLSTDTENLLHSEIELLDTLLLQKDVIIEKQKQERDALAGLLAIATADSRRLAVENKRTERKLRRQRRSYRVGLVTIVAAVGAILFITQ